MTTRTLKRLERAAMRMVDRNGWLITQESCKTFHKRRDDFEDVIQRHISAKKRAVRNAR